MMHTETLIGIIASICTSAALLPQLVKLIKEKKSDDISLLMLVSLFAGLGLWVWYGILRNDLIIIFANSFSFSLNLAIAALSIRYKS
jgi:MtN3 and saliva related transmembrane protein